MRIRSRTYSLHESHHLNFKISRTLELDEIIYLSKEEDSKEADEEELNSKRAALIRMSQLPVKQPAAESSTPSSFGSNIAKSLAKLSITVRLLMR